MQELPKMRRILVFINPFGGAGAAAANWLIARPLFDLASSRFQYTVIETERRNHAYDYVQKMEPGTFDSIVSVSGDGLLHEIVNGLMKRPDWLKIKDTLTIGGIPGGTGNGLIKSLLEIEGENYGV